MPVTDFEKPKGPDPDDFFKPPPTGPVLGKPGSQDLPTSGRPDTPEHGRPAPAPSPSNPAVGYVQFYKLELHFPTEVVPGINRPHPFFTVRLVDGPTDDAAGTAHPWDFLLLRSWSSSAVDGGNMGQWPTVTYGNVEQAIVATLKDALLEKKPVIIEWWPEYDMVRDATTGRRIIRSVQLSRT